VWTLNILLPFGIRIVVSTRALLLVLAALLAVALSWAFVEVLHQGLERGERLRAEQRRVATQPVHRAVRTAALEAAADKP